MKTFKVCTVFGDFYREAETAEQAQGDFWEWLGMSDQRVDELFVVREGEGLEELQQLLVDAYEYLWPEEVVGKVTLARTRAGRWRVRGSVEGMAEWDGGKRDWRIRMVCPACGSERWDDEPAPRNPCCQSADFAGGAG